MQAAEFSTGQGAWRVVHARATGTSHITSGLPCQDALGWRLLPCGLLAIALADGAGSAPMSETGAGLAVEEALTSLENSPANQTPQDMEAWGVAMQQVFQTARARLLREAETVGLPANALATTLTCLIAAEDGLVFGQVGDGLLIARTPQGDLYTLSQAQRGEYANETVFLTMEDALERVYLRAVELDLSGLALMSDGLMRLAVQLPDYTPHSPFFVPLWAFAARNGPTRLANLQLAEFLASERVCSRTDDDKSLVIAVKPGYDFQAPTPDQAQSTNQAEG
jgi:hypothetical protein